MNLTLNKKFFMGLVGVIAFGTTSFVYSITADEQRAMERGAVESRAADIAAKRGGATVTRASASKDAASVQNIANASKELNSTVANMKKTVAEEKKIIAERDALAKKVAELEKSAGTVDQGKIDELVQQKKALEDKLTAAREQLGKENKELQVQLEALKTQVAGDKELQAKYDDAAKQIDQAKLDYQKEVKAKDDAIAALQQELAKLQKMFTDKNAREAEVKRLAEEDAKKIEGLKSKLAGACESVANAIQKDVFETFKNEAAFTVLNALHKGYKDIKSDKFGQALYGTFLFFQNLQEKTGKYALADKCQMSDADVIALVTVGKPAIEKAVNDCVIAAKELNSLVGDKEKLSWLDNKLYQQEAALSVKLFDIAPWTSPITDVAAFVQKWTDKFGTANSAVDRGLGGKEKGGTPAKAWYDELKQNFAGNNGVLAEYNTRAKQFFGKKLDSNWGGDISSAELNNVLTSFIFFASADNSPKWHIFALNKQDDFKQVVEKCRIYVAEINGILDGKNPWGQAAQPVQPVQPKVEPAVKVDATHDSLIKACKSLKTALTANKKGMEAVFGSADKVDDAIMAVDAYCIAAKRMEAKLKDQDALNSLKSVLAAVIGSNATPGNIKDLATNCDAIVKALTK